MTVQIDRMLRLKEVMDCVGLGRSSIYAKMKDGTFPVPVKLSKRAVGWRASDVATWIAERGAQPRSGQAVMPPGVTTAKVTGHFPQGAGRSQ